MKTDQTPVQGRGLRYNANIAAADSAVAQETAGDEFCGVDPNGKAQPLGHHDRRSVHPYDLTFGGDERSAGVSGIQSRVSLDDVVDQASGLGAQGASQGADHASSYGVLESIRVSDGNHQLANSQFL